MGDAYRKLTIFFQNGRVSSEEGVTHVRFIYINSLLPTTYFDEVLYGA